MCQNGDDSKKFVLNAMQNESSFVSKFSSPRTPRFVFPPAPRLSKSADDSSCSQSCPSDSSFSDGQIIGKSKRKGRRKSVRNLPALGVFWDIENCQVPKHKSASSVVWRIRELFYDAYKEVDFVVVCDVKKENPQIVQELNDAQVSKCW